ncbi:TPA: hypothetical protein IUV20_002588 [Enterococcus faecalis]|nr:hypothetical protein [Enterococcus faecalis]
MIEVIETIMIRMIMIAEFAWKHKIETGIILFLFLNNSIEHFFFRVLPEAIFETLLEIIEVLASTIS